MTVVVVDPALEADAAVGFGPEAPGVEEFVGEGAVEALGFAVGLGPVRAGAQVRDAPPGQQFGEERRAEVRAVVGHDRVQETKQAATTTLPRPAKKLAGTCHKLAVVWQTQSTNTKEQR